MFKSLVLRALFAMVALAVVTPRVAFAVTVVPTSLSPGDQYRLVFVTTGTLAGTSSSISTYNDFVTNEANGQSELAALGTTWTAIASTATTNAKDNTSTAGTGVPIFLLNDTKLADSNADLWDGSVDAPLNIARDGSGVGSSRVWTGTQFTGGTNVGFELGISSAGFGCTSDATAAWMSCGTATTTSSYRLYGISAVLTVPSQVPIPAALPLFSSGLALIGVMGWRRKQTGAASA